MDVRAREFTNLRIPSIFNLRSDPFERADESMMPLEASNQLSFLVPCQALLGKLLDTFQGVSAAMKRMGL